MPLPATKTDSFHVTASAWVVNSRLLFHSQPGKILAGLNYDLEGTRKVDGFDDLPLLQPWSIMSEEIVGPGAGSVEGGTLATKTTIVFRLATARKAFFFRRDPTASSQQQKGLLEWLALICDAIELTEAASPVADPRLLNTLEKPVTFKVEQSEQSSQAAFQVFLEVELNNRHLCRGGRSNKFSGTLG